MGVPTKIQITLLHLNRNVSLLRYSHTDKDSIEDCLIQNLHGILKEHSQKRIMKPFAFPKPHDLRVFTKEYS